MQTPTAPTKPTPPTPPSMKTSKTVPSTDTHTPAKPTTQTTTPTKETPKVSATDQSQATSGTEAKNNIPPLGSYSNSTKETTSETKTPPTIPSQKNSPAASSGMTIFLALTIFITLGLVAVHWFKNNKPKQKSTINYSSESTDDLVDLILSNKTAEPAPPVAAKVPPKKLLLKPATKPKTKGGFEVRI